MGRWSTCTIKKNGCHLDEYCPATDETPVKCEKCSYAITAGFGCNCRPYDEKPNCIFCSNENCKKCVVGYFLFNGNCISCPDGCVDCYYPQKCNKCADQYVFDDARAQCVPACRDNTNCNQTD
uniref:Cysteine-rich protein n=1 Tax=Spironucleus salmonicida TaxID=348837 RepID=V6M1K8_9EUKA|eukprot:EST46753.1 Cysteine-rich protein [Spironucleus salmonicida]